ncbi:hypothetical protein GRI89_01340 [Altererythrobacter salegens]|uniref:PilZ domain-containing protein n=1 Tax=Croceibacterium salegens TaxID=1737568 RepID=A0A6I4SRH4_9SPHN|nr:PilZ domain-containing protein [Croceibacterium salegens]MXO58189.1 hypothetical protein [Croceibacterium salegens]
MDERRSSPRVATNVAVACRAPATPVRVVIRDISLHGCRIETARPMDNLGSTVQVELTDKVSVSGRIVWIDELYCGIRFDKRLDITKFGVRGWITSIGESVPLREIDRAA